MEQRISMITLGVSNLARARAFYEGMGWSALPSESDQIVFFDLNGVIVGLFGGEALDADMGRQNPTNGRIALAYNVRSRDEVQPILDQAAQLAGLCSNPVKTSSGRAFRLFR